MASIVRLLLLCVAILLPRGVEAQVDLEPYLARDSVGQLRISPTGEYYAATVPGPDTTTLVIFRREKMEVTGTLRFQAGTHVDQVWWVNAQRLVVSIAESYGEKDQPFATGELYGINADGTGKQLLAGWRTSRNDSAYVVGGLPGDDDHILISSWDIYSRNPITRIQKLNVNTGRRTEVAQGPFRRARLVTDSRGVARFALGVDDADKSQLFYRDGQDGEWQSLNMEADSGRVVIPLGFSADDRTAYLRVSHETGPDSIEAMEVVSGTRKQVVRDALRDPVVLYSVACGMCKVPLGIRFDGVPSGTSYIAGDGSETRQLRALEAALGASRVWFSSSTRDGRYKVVLVESDIDPGSFHLFDGDTGDSKFIIARSKLVDPRRMSPMQPISLKARDGLDLHGYLTLPGKAAAKPVPMVVMPHGGPYGIYDGWGYDVDTQMLAEAGYAVLRINFRGSGNQGAAFRRAGAKEWGRKMQDDLTDATRWAIDQGMADGERICIYGASYGGYAALMGVAREPGLYRCAVGYVGVYDLKRLRRENRSEGRAMRNWSAEWVGDDPAALEAVSPNRLAGHIKAPVFLAAGGADGIAPIEHTEAMERALKQVGVPVESLYYPDEGHGFYKEPHKREFYTRLLAFLSRHLGGQPAKSAPESASP